MTCACISYNRPEPDQTDPEVVLTVPAGLRVEIGRDTVCVDACIAGLIQDMWAAGIITMGCCCGHNGRGQRSVIVPDDQASTAKAFLVARGDPMAVMCWRFVEVERDVEVAIEVYSRGFMHCSVCAPSDMPREEIERLTNIKNPTGLDHGWRISDDKTFANGLPNPNPCEARDGHVHYLMVC